MTETKLAPQSAQNEDDGFFHNLANSKPYLKVAFQGFAGCLTGDTKIPTNRAGNGRTVALKDLYKRVNGLDADVCGKHYDKSIPTKARALKGDRFGLHNISGVVQSGIKPVYKLCAGDGFEIRATAEHRFLAVAGDGAERGWLPLNELRVGMRIFANGFSLDKDGYVLVTGLKHHPECANDPYKRLRKHRLVVEAEMNGITFDVLCQRLRSGDVFGLKFLEPYPAVHVHHKNGDRGDNRIENLEVLGAEEHLSRHGDEGQFNLDDDDTIIPRAVEVTSIIPAGEEMTYDIQMEAPYHSFVANGFVVHNSGKSHTMANLAIGLHKRIQSTKPIVSFDTEMAMHALKPLFDAAGIKVLRKTSRSLADLMETMKRCREGLSDILLIDSITHVWEDVMQSYMRKKNRQRLQFEDWSVLKPTWKREFSDPFVRDPYHTLMTGRAGYEYSDEKDAEGRRQIYKTGIKMKVEGETAYEPDMLVLMERFEEVLGHDKSVWREATIIKDRSRLIDGKTFKNPTFDAFAPAIDQLLANPDYRVQEEADASQLFGSEDERKQFAIRRDVALEKIEGELTSAWPGSTADAKRSKVDALKQAFGTTSWTEIQRKQPEVLEMGFLVIEGLAQKVREAASIKEAA